MDPIIKLAWCIVFVVIIVKFAVGLYKASINKGIRPLFSFVFSAVAVTSVPGSFLAMIILGFKYLDDQNTILIGIWWLLTCYVPYFLFTRLSRLVGFNID